MPSMFQQVRRNPSSNLVDRRISRKVVRKTRGSRNLSPDFLSDEGEASRIAGDYIKQKFLNRIFNRRTARIAMNSLLTEPRTGLVSDFNNLLVGVGFSGKEQFIDFLLRTFREENIEKIKESTVTLRSGNVVSGFKFNSEIYLRETKQGLRAFRFKDNRFAKIPKNIRKALQ